MYQSRVYTNILIIHKYIYKQTFTIKFIYDSYFTIYIDEALRQVKVMSLHS
jgi:hypothetical protein